MKRILIAPLDWGLGHATRCIPIIRELLDRGCTVFVAGNGDSLTLLKNEFPELTYFTLPGYDPIYPTGRNMALKMLGQVPKFVDVIKREHQLIESIIANNKLDLIISDNRYGCWSAQVPCIFMTHQLNVQMPPGLGWLSKAVAFLNRRLLKKFGECWIPDFPDQEKNLSGELSAVHGVARDRVVFIGPLSRFRPSVETTQTYDIACVLSGPEPQRSIFEDIVLQQLKASGLRYVVVGGVFKQPRTSAPDVVQFLNSEGLQHVMSRSSLVIARSGYSTIMDLLALQKKGIVIPTPGQTEQEYLAERCNKRRALFTMPQETFNLSIALTEVKKYNGFDNSDDSADLLRRELDRVLTDETGSASLPK